MEHLTVLVTFLARKIEHYIMTEENEATEKNLTTSNLSKLKWRVAKGPWLTVSLILPTINEKN